MVNSYHLLVCTLNLLHINVKFSLETYETNKNSSSSSNLHQILLAKFKLTQKQIENDLIKSNTLLEYICSKYNGNLIEVKTINEHYFRPQIKSLLNQKILNSNANCDDDFLNRNVFFFTNSPSNSFKTLYTNLTHLYENLKLRLRNVRGENLNETSFNGAQDVDERLFLINNSETSSPSLKISSKSSKNKLIIKEAFISTPSTSLNLLLDMNDFNILENQEQCSFINKSFADILKGNDLDEENDSLELAVRKWARTLLDCLKDELEMVNFKFIFISQRIHL